MKEAKNYSTFFLIGAAAYWVPDILFHLVKPPHFVWISLLTFCVPMVVGITWFRLAKRTPFDFYPFGFPISMLVGIWVLGPLAIAVGMQSMGGKFLEPDNLMTFLKLWAAFPMATFMMATYSGSLGGVIITTVLLIIVSIISWKKMRKRTSVPA